MFESTVWEGGVLLKSKLQRYDKEIIAQRWLLYDVVMFESTMWGWGRVLSKSKIFKIRQKDDRLEMINLHDVWKHRVGGMGGTLKI